MRTLAVCGSDARRRHPGASFATVSIENVPVVFGLVDVDPPAFDPASPAHLNSVLVRTRAFSLNYRDKALMIMARDKVGPSSFYAVGSEFSGDVVAVGRDVGAFAVGDRVMSNPAYDWSDDAGLRGIPTNHASKEMLVVHQDKLVTIPPEMPYAVAGAFSVGAQTSYSMIRRLGVRKGASVLVTSSRSNTSLFAISALRKHDVNVFALTTSAGFDDRLRALGVHRVITYDGRDGQTAQSTLQDISMEIGGFDYVIDPFFNLFLPHATSLMAFRGSYVTCGFNPYRADSYQVIPGQVLTDAIVRNLLLIGNCLGTRQDLCDALADYAAGMLDVALDSVYEGSDVSGFLNRTFNAAERFGKVVFAYT